MKAMRIAFAISTVAALGLLATPSQANAQDDCNCNSNYGYNASYNGSNSDNYNGNSSSGPETYYAHPAYGRPLTMLLAPTVRKQINYNWGVPSVRVDPVPWHFHQGGASYQAGSTVAARPYWPTSTTQLGVYYMRAPW